MDFFKPELSRIVPVWPEPAPTGVSAFFTERMGGVSSGPWGGPEGIMGLNLAEHTGDAAACVRMNRQIVRGLVPEEPRWLTQVHGTTVLEADRIEGAPEADASYTFTPGVVCAVMTADCLPVLLADRSGRAVAAVHAGWRSLADGVIQKTVQAMLARDASLDLAAWLGPRIGADAFEVGEDVLEAMRAHLPEAQAAFRPVQGGKFLADLGLLARMALADAGIDEARTADCALSTYADPARFWSFRRDGERSGRHAALIWMKPEA